MRPEQGTLISRAQAMAALLELLTDQPGVPTAATQSISTSQARRDPVPFQPWAREKAQEILNLRSINDPTSRCLPRGWPVS